MKNLLLIPLAAALLGGPALAQDDDKQAHYQAEYEKKLAKEFVSFGGWITDYDEAREKARKEGKVLFTYFTRSYSP
jgi:hypothetical protein